MASVEELGHGHEDLLKGTSRKQGKQVCSNLLALARYNSNFDGPRGNLTAILVMVPG